MNKYSMFERKQIHKNPYIVNFLFAVQDFQSVIDYLSIFGYIITERFILTHDWQDVPIETIFLVRIFAGEEIFTHQVVRHMQKNKPNMEKLLIGALGQDDASILTMIETRSRPDARARFSDIFIEAKTHRVNWSLLPNSYKGEK